MDDTSRGWGLLLGHPRGPHVATSGDFATAMDSGRPSTYQEIAIMTAAKPRTARDRVDRLVAFYDQHGCQRLWRRLDGDDSNYGPLARLLVYRSIVTAADLALLEPVADR